MSGLASFLVDTFVVSGVVWPWVMQARAMEEKRDATGFSTLSCLTLLVSATLRIFFWMGKRYGTALLLQAIATVLTQLWVLKVVVRLTYGDPQRRLGSSSSSSSIGSGSGSSGALASSASSGNVNGAAMQSVRRKQDRNFLDCRPSDFWKWTDWESYVVFELTFVVLLMFLTGLFYPYPAYTELLGVASLGVEALMMVPQAVVNQTKRSAEGLSKVLLITMLAGDFFKAIYAIAKGEPTQFLGCAVFQLSIDVILAIQMVVYGKAARQLPPA